MLSTLLLSLISIFFINNTFSSQDTTHNQIQVNDFGEQEVKLLLDTFNGIPVSDIILKVDFIIESGKNDVEKSNIAYNIFNYYYKSHIMGYEECALYIADNYFLNKKLRLKDESKLMLIRMFAEFNRETIIGSKAPELQMENINGNIEVMPKGNTKYTIIYFYDDECVNCKLQTPQIMEYLNEFYTASVKLYRIYTQKDIKKWHSYISKLNSKFNSLPKNIEIIDLWDPEINSEFPKRYNVISTPQLFLLDKGHKVIGRKLNAKSLEQLIDIKQNEPNEFELFFNKVFIPLVNEDPSIGLNTEMAYKIMESFYLDSKYDEKIFNEIFYNLYHYLKKQTDYEFQKLAIYLAEKYIIDMPELWKNAKFSPLERDEDDGILVGNYSSPEDFIENTIIAVDLFKRNPLGEKCQNLTLKNSKNKNITIHDVKAKYTILYFYSLTCPVCEAVEQDMITIYKDFKDKGIEIVSINTGTKKKEWKKHIKKLKAGWIDTWDPKRESDFFNKYDLADVPAIYLLDENKITLAKDINPLMLQEILIYLTSED